jgi:peptidylprolyl isomerase
MNRTTAISFIILVAVLGLGVYLYTQQSTTMDSTQPAPQDSAQSSTEIVPGLTYELLQAGNDQAVAQGQTAVVHYTGTFTDGTKFDSSVDRGTPFEFVVGGGQVIKGWDLGVEGMTIGEKRRFTIAPDLAYGEAGFPGAIPPSSTLIFEVELVGIR